MEKDNYFKKTFNLDEMPEKKQKPEENGVGPVIGSVIVVILVLIAGLYLLGSIEDEPADVPEETNNQIIEEEYDAPTVKEINEQSDSDDLNSIESDLHAQSTNELDAELGDIEKELENL